MTTQKEVYIKVSDSLLRFCKNFGYSHYDLLYHYADCVNRFADQYDLYPVDDGVELIEGPYGEHRLVPAVKWIPMSGRAKNSNVYVWKTAYGDIKPGYRVAFDDARGNIRMPRPELAVSLGMYLTCDIDYFKPLRMGAYRSILTIEIMCPDTPRSIVPK